MSKCQIIMSKTNKNNEPVYRIDWTDNAEDSGTYRYNKMKKQWIKIGRLTNNSFNSELIDTIITKYRQQAEAVDKSEINFMENSSKDLYKFKQAFFKEIFGKIDHESDQKIIEILNQFVAEGELEKENGENIISPELIRAVEQVIKENGKKEVDFGDENFQKNLVDQIKKKTKDNYRESLFDKGVGTGGRKVYVRIEEREDDINPFWHLVDPGELEWQKEYRYKEDYVIKYREEEVKEIISQLDAEKYIFLYGEHGMGKTMLARTIASHYNETMFWLSYSKGEELIDTLLKLNTKWRPPTNYGTVEEIVSALNARQENNQQWLIIIDNCNTGDNKYMTELNQFIRQTGNMKFLITTTNQNFSYDKYGYHVKALKEEKYIALWKEMCGLGPENIADIEEFRRFRTLVQDNTYITCLVGSMCARGGSWIEKLRGINDKIDDGNLGECNQIAVNRTDMDRFNERGNVLEMINKLFLYDDITDEEFAVLYSLALFSLDGVDKEIFTELWETAEFRDDPLYSLVDRQWIREDKNRNRWYLHPVVRSVILDRSHQKDETVKLNIELITQFVERLADKMDILYKISEYECASYVELLYNCIEYLHPFGKEIFGQNHRDLVEDEVKLRPANVAQDGQRQRVINEDSIKRWSNKFTDESMKVLCCQVSRLAYLYSSLCEDTSLAPTDHAFPAAACVLRYLKCRMEWNEELSITDYRRFQGCAYSFFHTTTTDTEVKEKEVEAGICNIKYAQRKLEQKEDLLQGIQEQCDCKTVLALIHGNLGAYHKLKGIWKKAQDEYEESLRAREEILQILEGQQETDELSEKIKSIRLLCARALDNIAYAMYMKGTPTSKKCRDALEKLIQARNIRRDIRMENDSNVYRNHKMYLECFIKMLNANRRCRREDDNLYQEYKESRDHIFEFYSMENHDQAFFEGQRELLQHILPKDEIYLGKNVWEQELNKYV